MQHRIIFVKITLDMFSGSNLERILGTTVISAGLWLGSSALAAKPTGAPLIPDTAAETVEDKGTYVSSGGWLAKARNWFGRGKTKNIPITSAQERFEAERKAGKGKGIIIPWLQADVYNADGSLQEHIPCTDFSKTNPFFVGDVELTDRVEFRYCDPGFVPAQKAKGRKVDFIVHTASNEGDEVSFRGKKPVYLMELTETGRTALDHPAWNKAGNNKFRTLVENVLDGTYKGPETRIELIADAAVEIPPGGPKKPKVLASLGDIIVQIVAGGEPIDMSEPPDTPEPPKPPDKHGVPKLTPVSTGIIRFGGLLVGDGTETLFGNINFELDVEGAEGGAIVSNRYFWGDISLVAGRKKSDVGEDPETGTTLSSETNVVKVNLELVPRFGFGPFRVGPWVNYSSRDEAQTGDLGRNGPLIESINRTTLGGCGWFRLDGASYIFDAGVCQGESDEDISTAVGDFSASGKATGYRFFLQVPHFSIKASKDEWAREKTDGSNRILGDQFSLVPGSQGESLDAKLFIGNTGIYLGYSEMSTKFDLSVTSPDGISTEPRTLDERTYSLGFQRGVRLFGYKERRRARRMGSTVNIQTPVDPTDNPRNIDLTPGSTEELRNIYRQALWESASTDNSGPESPVAAAYDAVKASPGYQSLTPEQRFSLGGKVCNELRAMQADYCSELAFALDQQLAQDGVSSEKERIAQVADMTGATARTVGRRIQAETILRANTDNFQPDYVDFDSGTGQINYLGSANSDAAGLSSTLFREAS